MTEHRQVPELARAATLTPISPCGDITPEVKRGGRKPLSNTSLIEQEIVSNASFRIKLEIRMLRLGDPWTGQRALLALS
jgi:hypothetical protein